MFFVRRHCVHGVMYYNKNKAGGQAVQTDKTVYRLLNIYVFYNA